MSSLWSLCRRAGPLGQAGRRHLSLTPGAAASSRRTALHDFHVANGGKMVDFAGWRMPVQYAGQSIVDSCKHTRSHCSLFDVSHMLQTNVYGKHRHEFIESLTVADVSALPADFGTLTLFTNESGGIEDDLIVTRTSGDHLYVVTNAGRAADDSKLMQGAASKWRSGGKDVQLRHLDDRSLVALQGPLAAKLLQEGVSDNLDKLYFMHSVIARVFDAPDCRVTRCGYTGEDGFEISVAHEHVESVCARLLSDSAACRLAGLGARDALRLEAGLCLYGSDIDATTTPVEATLLWTVAKTRRKRADFPGAQAILAQVKDKSLVGRKRVGMVARAGRPPRGGASLIDAATGEQVGTVTSGCPSRNLRVSIAMGYVRPSFVKAGTQLLARQKSGAKAADTSVTVTKMPFVKAGYYTKPR